MVTYPADFPINEIKNVVAIVTNSQVVEKKADLAHDIWVVQGYGQKMIFGNPDIVTLSAVDEEDFDAIETLSKAVEKYECSECCDCSVSSQAALPWQLIVKWAIDYLIDVLEEKFE